MKHSLKVFFMSIIIIGFILLVNIVGCKSHPDVVNNIKPVITKDLIITLQPTSKFQTIKNFGASDAWSCQFVGKNWPFNKREKIADLLFSHKFKQDGTPEGIGLSSWRFNIGAGSSEQGTGSYINDEWRRAEGFMLPDGSYDWNSQQGQRWFLQAAKKRGVNQFYGFVNSPPVALTKNGRAYSSGGSSANLPHDNFDKYASFLTNVISHLKNKDSITFDYISPFNEPGANWDTPRQEGSPWLNSEIAEEVKKLDRRLTELNLSTKIEIPEADNIKLLFKTNIRTGRDNQIYNFFDSKSASFIGNLSHVAWIVAGHSYSTTWPLNSLVNTREELANKIQEYPNLEYAMSEYCLLENNTEIVGPGRDLGINPALYMARVLYADLTIAGATSWQWWLAVSPYDYKDGLIYIDKDKYDGAIYPSKMLWALGNFSRFVSPGMIRIGIKRSDKKTVEQSLNGVMITAFYNPENKKTVTIAINYGYSSIPLKIKRDNGFINCSIYRTSYGNDNLSMIGTSDFKDAFILKPRSITTFVEK